MSRLTQELLRYGESGFYPFHMPGHKRNMRGGPLSEAMGLDITEIDGFDDLHRPHGLILEAEREAASLYGSEETLFLVNGSTAGVLSAVLGSVSRGGTLVMARNCHKSVYNAALLGELNTVYLYPEMETGLGIHGGIFVSDVERALEENPGAEAVIVTSPTYDGVVSDVKAIARAVHARRIPLIVDEAHGAHFGFHPGFPESSVHRGADVVIHSLHKTLPAMTQTALIHLNGELADRDRIRGYLAMLQSSSPSYVLMASIDRCVEMLKEQGDKLFSDFYERLGRLRESLQGLSHIRLAGRELVGRSAVFDYDPSRVLLSTRGTAMTGPQLYERLRSAYRLQPEMASFDYILAITGIMDTEEGLGRLEKALRAIDGEMAAGERQSTGEKAADTAGRRGNAAGKPGRTGDRDVELVGPPQAGGGRMKEPAMTLGAAAASDMEEIAWEDCEGRISGVAVCLYPPGIPVLLPGERITGEARRRIGEAMALGLTVQGLAVHGLTVQDLTAGGMEPEESKDPGSTGGRSAHGEPAEGSGRRIRVVKEP